VFTYSFPRAQEAVSDHLGGGGRQGESEGLVLGGVVTSNASVDILEDLIESELSESLSRVSDESGSPSLENSQVWWWYLRG